MILNRAFIQTYIVPKIKKASLWVLFLLICLITILTIILMIHDIFSYTLSLTLLTFVSLIFILPIYLICYKYFIYFHRLSRFIKTHESVDFVYKEIRVLAYGDVITLQKLLFIPVSCVVDNTEKIYYIPFNIFQFDMHEEVLQVIFSDQFIIGINYE